VCQGSLAKARHLAHGRSAKKMIWIIIAIAAVAILLFKRHCDRRPDPSIDQIIKTISDFIEDKGGAWDWDDFTTIPLRTPELEKIRKECFDVHWTYPSKDKRSYCSPEGVEVLKKLLSQLKQMPNQVPVDTAHKLADPQH
jgi:hypothetical protein